MIPNRALVQQVADIILSRAIYEGREGDGVTQEDREDYAPYIHCWDAAERLLSVVLPEWAAQTLETEASEYDRGVNRRCIEDARAEIRCDFCGLQYYEQDEYLCGRQDGVHDYDPEELDSVGPPLDAPTFYGDVLRRKAAAMREEALNE